MLRSLSQRHDRQTALTFSLSLSLSPSCATLHARARRLRLPLPLPNSDAGVDDDDDSGRTLPREETEDVRRKLNSREGESGREPERDAPSREFNKRRAQREGWQERKVRERERGNGRQLFLGAKLSLSVATATAAAAESQPRQSSTREPTATILGFVRHMKVLLRCAHLLPRRGREARARLPSLPFLLSSQSDATLALCSW